MYGCLQTEKSGAILKMIIWMSWFNWTHQLVYYKNIYNVPVL